MSSLHEDAMNVHDLDNLFNNLCANVDVDYFNEVFDENDNLFNENNIKCSMYEKENKKTTLKQVIPKIPKIYIKNSSNMFQKYNNNITKPIKKNILNKPKTKRRRKIQQVFVPI